MCDYQDSVTTLKTDTRTDGQNRQKPDKVIPMCHYASQATIPDKFITTPADLFLYPWNKCSMDLPEVMHVFPSPEHRSFKLHFVESHTASFKNINQLTVIFVKDV